MLDHRSYAQFAFYQPGKTQPAFRAHETGLTDPFRVCGVANRPRAAICRGANRAALGTFLGPPEHLTGWRCPFHGRGIARAQGHA